jgi:hypothetical protein
LRLFCCQVIKGKQVYSHPYHTHVYKKAAERNRRKTGELYKRVPVSIFKREILIQAVDDQDPTAVRYQIPMPSVKNNNKLISTTEDIIPKRKNSMIFLGLRNVMSFFPAALCKKYLQVSCNYQIPQHTTVIQGILISQPGTDIPASPGTVRTCH